MTIEEKLMHHIADALAKCGSSGVPVVLERPGNLTHGDFATNVAMVAAKQAGKNPRALAEEIVAQLRVTPDADISTIEIAGPGFINFRLSPVYFTHALTDALSVGDTFGDNKSLEGKKVVVEYTDPNPFKEFHIGHLMPNVIGESVSRLIEASGADTQRVCYQGDKGLHVAFAVAWIKDFLAEFAPKAGDLWGYMKSLPKEQQKELYLLSYAKGRKKYGEDSEYVRNINKEIYESSMDALSSTMIAYRFGREGSLATFEEIYKRLGTNHGSDGKGFNEYFFESNTGVVGKEIVLAHLDDGIFEKSDGAIVYKGDESKGLHTRVFINKEGLPTYEAKELGLAEVKHKWYPYDISVVITANEVNDYFAVLLDAMSKVFPELAAKTEHIGHGMLRLPTGKMSSRTGDVITAEWLIEETKSKARGKITSEQLSEEEKEEVAEEVAIGAIKYSILRQAAGKDIIFDFEQSLSFEGDSGPYLQYTYARTQSLLAKAKGKPIDPQKKEGEVNALHKYLLRFPEVVLRAQQERAPHFVSTYLIEVAREFNSFYGNTIVLDGTPDEPYKLALVQATSYVLARGLWLLGIPAPMKM